MKLPPIYKGIREYSHSDKWSVIQKEWSLKEVQYNPGGQTCLCGHEHIVNICVVVNNINGNVVEIGNECVRQFFGIKIGITIINAARRVNLEPYKSIGRVALSHAKKVKLLARDEYQFYFDTVGKRESSLNDAQSKYRKFINEKFVEYVFNKKKIKTKSTYTYKKGQLWTQNDWKAFKEEEKKKEEDRAKRLLIWEAEIVDRKIKQEEEEKQKEKERKEDTERIEVIKKWKEENPNNNFNMNFTLTIEEKLDRYGFLFPGQRNALDNIINKVVNKGKTFN